MREACHIVVMAFNDRLRAFYRNNRLYGFVGDDPVTRAVRVARLVSKKIVVVSDRTLSLPADICDGLQLIKVSPRKANLTSAFAIIRNLPRPAPTLLVVDGAAPLLEAATLIRMIRSRRDADLVQLRENSAAFAISNSVFTALSRVPLATLAADLSEWISLSGAGAGSVFNIRVLDGTFHYERPLMTIQALQEGLEAQRLQHALKLVQRGLGLLDPVSFSLRGRLRFGQNVSIGSNVIIIGNVQLGDNVAVGDHCILQNCRLFADVVVKEFTTITDSKIGRGSRVGPFARLRPGCAIGAICQIGNYVEIKGTRMRDGCKINHHSFIGDAQLGKNVIFGAGSITCNFDGKVARRTVVRDDAFVGSGVMLIAPITVGRGAFIAAGSTVTKNAPAGSLTIARAKQVSRPNWKKGNTDTDAKLEKHYHRRSGFMANPALG